MLRFLVLASFAALALAQLAPEPRYLEDVNSEERIVGGEVANANSWPWQVSVQGYLEGSWQHACTAVLVKRGWVLTSVPCAISEIPLRVVLGEHDIYNHEGREQYISVSQIYVHPSWDLNYYPDNNIALLRLSSEASLNNYVQLGVLPPSDQVLPNNNPCYFTGWGYNDSEGKNFPTPTQVYLPIYDHNTCSTSSWWDNPVKTSMICAGGGETGCLVFYGPLNCSVGGQWVVHGLTSFWPHLDCNPFVVFTRVSNYISWINSIMG